MWEYKSPYTPERSNAAFGMLQQCSANILPFSTAVLADAILSPSGAALTLLLVSLRLASLVRAAGTETLRWLSSC